MKKAILSTLAYADVFDYPLTPGELYRFLIADKALNYSRFRQALTRMNTNEKQIDTNGEYFFLRDRRKIVVTRKKREKWSQGKLRIAKQVANWLKLIPTIKMVAVTGALAMGNSDKEDDIDLLIVTSKNRLWLTRGLVVTFLCLTGLYRRPGKIKDKICPNMFLDEKHLEVPKKEQDLFSAHEVCQLKPIWDKDNCYQKFLKANLWSKKYLANWKP